MKAIIFVQIKEEGSIYGRNIQPIVYSPSEMSYDNFDELEEYLNTKECGQLDQQFMPNQVEILDVQLKVDDQEIWYEVEFKNLNESNTKENLKSIFIDVFKKVGICGEFTDAEMPEEVDCDEWELTLSIEIDEENTKIED